MERKIKTGLKRGPVPWSPAVSRKAGYPYHMTSYTLFAYLMDSLDSAFRALQGLDTWQPDGWGERFFTELSREHSEWADKRTSIYMTGFRASVLFCDTGR